MNFFTTGDLFGYPNHNPQKREKWILSAPPTQNFLVRFRLKVPAPNFPYFRAHDAFEMPCRQTFHNSWSTYHFNAHCGIVTTEDVRTSKPGVSVWYPLECPLSNFHLGIFKGKFLRKKLANLFELPTWSSLTRSICGNFEFPVATGLLKTK